jgi:flavin reductase (DIM6/NTAB) family NADH-FMN oxidoreductase RutF
VSAAGGRGAKTDAPFVTLDPAGATPREVYDLMISAIVPRPIALTSTSDGAGGRNLAPFSYFMGVSSAPPVVAISLVRRRHGDKKDTLRNVETTGEFVVNVVTEAMAQAMNATAADAPFGEDEFALAGLTPLPGVLVSAPRVAESPVQMECRLDRVIEVGSQPAYLILGEVVLFHVREDVLEGGRIEPAALRPLARLGGSQYAGVRGVFSMPRPGRPGPAQVRAGSEAAESVPAADAPRPVAAAEASEPVAVETPAADAGER